MDTDSDHLMYLVMALGEQDNLVRHIAEQRRGSMRADGCVDRIISLADFDRLLATAAVPAKVLLLVREGRRLPMAMYCDPTSGAILPDALRQLRGQDVSIVINHIHRYLPAVAQAARSLEARIGKRVSVNAYLTAGRHGAFPAHFDGHDVLVVQICGAKLWSCYGPTAQPIIAKGASEDVSARRPEWQGTLRPGDMLYLPCGEVHRAEPVDPPSLHLSLGLSTARAEA